MRYVAKPVIIEAIQWDGTFEGYLRMFEAWDLPFAAKSVAVDGPNARLKIKTPEGDLWISRTDWVIKGTEGEFYPCKDSVFRNKYIPVEPITKN